MNIISIVSCRFWLNFERFLLFNVRSQMYNNWITKIFILLVTSTWHSPWNGWQVFLSLLSSKILFKEDTLFTHTKSDDPPAPDCLLIQMTIFHLQIRWFLLHSATNHTLYTKQHPLLMIFNFRTLSQFSCARREVSQKKERQFQYLLSRSWPNKKQEAKLKTCPTLIMLTIK